MALIILSFSRGSLRAHTIIHFCLGYTYSIRLFLIEAKHRYKKGRNINRKHTLKIYKVQKVYIYIYISGGAVIGVNVLR